MRVTEIVDGTTYRYNMAELVDFHRAPIVLTVRAVCEGGEVAYIGDRPWLFEILDGPAHWPERKGTVMRLDAAQLYRFTAE
jgi:hypothetical protein